MYQTVYHRPGSLKEAAEIFHLSQDASYLSGGHTLIPTMKNRLAAPTDLIDVRRILELKGIRIEDGGVFIGAAQTHFEVSSSSKISAAIPALSLLAGSIGDVQVRHLGTIGGSVANNDPAADYPAAVLALNSIIHTDIRAIDADDYFTGLYSTALEPGEIITHISFKIPQTAGYAKFRNPASRYALAAVFVSQYEGGEVRVAVTGAGDDGVFRWSEAEAALAARFAVDAVSELYPNADELTEDMHASRDYRADLVRVMTCRAVANIGGVSIS